MPFVVDASVVLAWHFADESWPDAHLLAAEAARDRPVAPSYLALEVANGLLRGERMGRTRRQAVDMFLARFQALGIELRGFLHHEVIGAVLPLAREHGLKLFDAGYLHVAMTAGLAIATFDDRLAAAARTLHIPIKDA